MNKVYKNADEAIADIKDGMTLMLGGFGLCGIPENCIAMAGLGIPAFFTPAGYGTEIAEGKETREFNGKMYLMEMALHADFAMVKAWKGDTMGNLVFRKTTRNYSVPMAKAGDITIAEVEHLVQPGELDPDQVHVPGIYVHRIFEGKGYEKRIERRTVSN